MFILNANAYARNPVGAGETVEKTITSAGGTILASRLWNEQKLAYPVNGQRKGVYWLTYFEVESTEMPKFNRACQLQEMILRHLAIKIDPRLVEMLVAVAKGERQMPTVEIASDAKSDKRGDIDDDSDESDD
jgi:small subunit ribosomal protein S6